MDTDPVTVIVVDSMGALKGGRYKPAPLVCEDDNVVPIDILRREARQKERERLAKERAFWRKMSKR